MLLTIDIGNTNIKIGLFQGTELRYHWRIATDRTRLADEYAMLMFDLFASENVSAKAISGCAISSVVPVLAAEFSELTERYFHLDPLVVGPGTDFGIDICTDNPAEVGSDLIAGAVAAKYLFGTPVIVVGFGTATTFVGVSASGNLEGVAISPGIITGADSLFKAAAVLPQIALNRPSRAIGKNTIQSMQSGIVFGYAAMVEGLVRRFKAELNESARVIATGGLAELIAREARVIEAVEPNLNLIGLRLIHERCK